MKNKLILLFKNKKVLISLALIAIVVAVFSYSSLALIKASTVVVKNQFEVPKTDIEIFEDFENGDSVKENVYIKNTGEATMYVRVAVVEQLKNASGLIVANTNGTDYFSYYDLTGENWITGDDGYYYYTKALEENEITRMLFTKAEPIYKVKGGEKLSLNIMAEAIQVNGIEKWTNVTKQPDGTLGGAV